MNSKHLLVETSRNPFARQLLRSADLDEPPPHSALRLAVALGLGSSALVSTIATGAAATGEATVGATLAAAAKGLAAAPVAGAAVSSSIAAGTGALGSATAVSGTAVLSSAASLSAATAAAPAVGSALSAVGMLKAMAVVSLTCGALSFGGTKLAMKITDDAPTVSSSSRMLQPSAPQPKRTASRVIASSPASEPAPAPPAPAPAAQDDDVDDDEVLPALVQQTQRANALHDTTQQGSPERNVGRQDIELNTQAQLGDGLARPQASLATAELTGTAGDSPANRGAVATFPSDDEPAAPGLNPQAEKKPKAHQKARKVEPDANIERELLLLDRARSAVAAGQPLVALQALDAYRTQAQRGTLRAESLVLRVKALLALGQRTAAERDAMPFIKAAPQSRHAARLRELLGVPNDPP
jgi:hypothetical protein